MRLGPRNGNSGTAEQAEYHFSMCAFKCMASCVRARDLTFHNYTSPVGRARFRRARPYIVHEPEGFFPCCPCVVYVLVCVCSESTRRRRCLHHVYLIHLARCRRRRRRLEKLPVRACEKASAEVLMCGARHRSGWQCVCVCVYRV